MRAWPKASWPRSPQLCTGDGTPGWAFQQITAASTEHGGHRLGLMVEIANLEQPTSDNPSAWRILTGNAGPNRYMIAINEMLGFHVSDQYRYRRPDLAADIGAAGSQRRRGGSPDTAAGPARHPAPGLRAQARGGVGSHHPGHTRDVAIASWIFMHCPSCRKERAHMRADLTAMLQQRWEASLQDRARLSQRSIVPALDALLAGRREHATKIGSHLAPRIGHRAKRLR